MGTCFVMQRFDRGGPYDKRYREVFIPAIEAAGVESYRVDQDANALVPIQSIEDGIRSSVVCLADISIDNPNVWYELGFAHALGRGVVMVCAAELRDKFPFDIQHRRVLTYSRESPSDFIDLQKKITEQLYAHLEKAKKLETLESISPLKEISGLSEHEIALLLTIVASEAGLETPTRYSIGNDMERQGYTRYAVALGIRALAKKGMIESYQQENDHDNGTIEFFQITESSEAWLLKNEDKIKFKTERPPQSYGSYGGKTKSKDEDIPF